MNFYKAYRQWRREKDPTGIRSTLRTPSYTRLYMTPVEGDKLQVYKEWADTWSKTLHHRVPGNWTTKRGRKKRIKALHHVFR